VRCIGTIKTKERRISKKPEKQANTIEKDREGRSWRGSSDLARATESERELKQLRRRITCCGTEDRSRKPNPEDKPGDGEEDRFKGAKKNRLEQLVIKEGKTQKGGKAGIRGGNSWYE